MVLSSQSKQQQETTTRSGSKGQASVRTLQSQTLLQGFAEVTIEHDGVLYKLRHTKQGKLILTK